MKDSGSGRSDITFGVGAVLAMAFCCAAPLLVAAGVLGAVGSVFRNPFVIAAAAILVFLFLTGARRRAGDGAGCPPSSRHTFDSEERGPRTR